MAKDAPDERAQSLADKILGKSATESSVAAMIAGNVKIGARNEDGKPTGRTVTAEEYRSGQRTRAVDDTPDDDEDEFPNDGEEGGDDDEYDDTEDDEEDDPDADDEEGDDDLEEEGDDDEEDEDDEYETVDYNDEDTLEVKVDGEVREVSLRDLKRVYSLNKATEKRLQEATEARTAANAEREKVEAEIQTHRGNMLRTIQQLDGVLFTPLVDEPDPALRTKNMQQYLLQKDAWEEDQKRIVAGRQELAQFLAGEHQKMNESRQNYRAEQQKILAEKLPELVDPEKTQKVQKDIMDAASFYGFTPEMVAQVDHAGLFLMARDAARWLNMQKMKQSGKIPTSGDGTTQVKRRKRHLRAGTATSSNAKLKLVRSQKEQVAATNKAQASGRVDDVANMLISKARIGSKKSGRRL